MNTKHTPGPWHVGMKPGPAVYGPEGEQVAGLFVPMLPEDENRANARLIAAAPDLLATLETIASQCGTFAERQPALDYASIGNIARAAIFKAKGEA